MFILSESTVVFISRLELVDMGTAVLASITNQILVKLEDAPWEPGNISQTIFVRHITDFKRIVAYTSQPSSQAHVIWL
ncbi:hypothetical protein Avbf_16463 [Armadillidium vulgare]|nr:hypothetical protein Avbf_16463 [Armadillidium vulgare]